MNWIFKAQGGDVDWSNMNDPIPSSSSDPAYLFHPDFISQFTTAINERVYLFTPLKFAATGSAQSAITDFADNVQSLTTWRNMWFLLSQMVNSTACGFFNTYPMSVVDVSTLGVTPSTFSSVAWTGPTLAAAAGIEWDTVNGVFAPRQRNGENLTDSFVFRRMAQGDIIGPWCFEDLRKVISRLHAAWAEIVSGQAYLDKGVPQAEWKQVPYDAGPSSPSTLVTYAEFLTQWNNAALEYWTPSTSVLSPRSFIAKRSSDAGDPTYLWAAMTAHARHVWKYPEPSAAVNAYTFSWSLFYYSAIPTLNFPRTLQGFSRWTKTDVFNDYESVGTTQDAYSNIASGSETGVQYHDSGGYLPAAHTAPPDGGANTLTGAQYHPSGCGLISMCINFQYE